jgi:transposase
MCSPAQTKEELMTATTRPTECSVTGATWYLAFELGSTKWTLGFTTAPAQRPRGRIIAAGDLRALEQELLSAKGRFGLPLEAPVRSCYEAGREGFWLHRWLTEHGVENIVVDSSSIEVNRKARRAKTDRLDVRKLLSQLLRWVGGERRAWSVVQVPSPAAEDDRQLPRELEAVQEDRTRVRNRIHGLLAIQGVRLSLDRHFESALAQVRTGAGHPFPAALRDRLTREWAHLQIIEARLGTLSALRDARIAHGTDRVAQVARRLLTMRGVGEVSAVTFSAELFGTRTFQNPRQLGALTGLVPVPYRSDQRVQDQGISKAGRGAIRGLAIQIAWGWVRWQPDSALTQWFVRRFATAGKRARRIGIVALARKLIIALWRYVEHGVVPDGAVVTPTPV